MQAATRILNGFLDQPAGLYCSNRLLEWLTTAMILTIASITAIPMMDRLAFAVFYDFGLSTRWVAALLFIVGAMRAMALIANGRAPLYGPRMRTAGCIAGTLIWVAMMVSLMRSGLVPLSAAVYFFLAIGETVSCYRAATDVRLSHQ